MRLAARGRDRVQVVLVDHLVAVHVAQQPVEMVTAVWPFGG